MLQKVMIRTTEEGTNLAIVETMLSIYPYHGVMQTTRSDNETRYTFLIKKSNLWLLRHDLRNFKVCGFDVEGVKVL